MQKKNERPSGEKRTASAAAPVNRPTHPPPPAIYALRVWSVKKVNGKWYISQAARFDDKEQWSRPYAILQRAMTAIARKMAEEIIDRHKRRCDYYGIND
jgi:hypothetical protein